MVAGSCRIILASWMCTLATGNGWKRRSLDSKKTKNNCCQTIGVSLSMRANAPLDGAGANRFCSKMHKKWTDKQLTSEERMKFNKWTIGLAAAGIVTLPSLVKADPVEMVKTAAADT